MPTVIACPSCQKQLKVPDELIGRNVKCPGCKETFTAQVAGGSSTGSKSDIAEKPRKKPAPPPEEEEDEEQEAPLKKAKARDDADDDDADERPSKRVKRSGGPMAPHRGTLWLILGLGAALLWLVTGIPSYFAGPFVWWLAKKDLAEMDAGRMDPEGRQNTQIGMYCGIASTVIMGFGLLIGLLVCVLFCLIPLIAGGAGAAGH